MRGRVCDQALSGSKAASVSMRPRGARATVEIAVDSETTTALRLMSVATCTHGRSAACALHHRTLGGTAKCFHFFKKAFRQAVWLRYFTSQLSRQSTSFGARPYPLVAQEQPPRRSSSERTFAACFISRSISTAAVQRLFFLAFVRERAARVWRVSLYL